MDHAIEHVAKAFYDAYEDARGWEKEPEIMKEEFRMFAREAIALLEECKEIGLHAAAHSDAKGLLQSAMPAEDQAEISQAA